MAAPKKTTTKKTAKPKTATAKKAPAAKATPAPAAAAGQDAVQEIMNTVKGFQINTLVALGLALAFLIFQLFPETRFNWLLNIPVAAVSGFLFWRQGDVTKGIEQKVCRYGLLGVAAVFLWRDINISQDLADFVDRYGDLNDLFTAQ